MNLPLLSPDELREDLYANETLWRSSTRGVVLCNGAEHVDDVEYWLSYMPMRNRAEVIRLMLAYADVPYAFEVVGYLRYEPEVKPTMNFGKTPALVDIDGQGTDLTHETAVTGTSQTNSVSADPIHSRAPGWTSCSRSTGTPSATTG